MATPKYKHFKFEDRYTIQEFLRFGYSFTAIAKRLGKDRRAVSKEVFHLPTTKFIETQSALW